ncbi:hypothetical protein K9N68_21440 [Kovacikia minuta CCNUW1]|uniref:hypothetical protein n=1 Tax=Kovacikia minuta TaxID=2931930 RepID=UPI001CCBD511|nr:hypothetical protein [Kovacikia minuta]UBF24263.1 hypothetical protein K9N68_21440 [Kovacikia minuta CCNUW1]
MRCSIFAEYPHQKPGFSKYCTDALEAGWQAIELSPNRERFSPMDYIIDQLGYNEVEDCSGTGMGLLSVQLCRCERSEVGCSYSG